jgi:recombination protein RecT
MSIVQKNGGARRGFLELLEVAKPQIAAILPAGVNVDRVVQVARAAYHSDAKLQQCSPGSLLQAVGQAAQLGLTVGRPLNHAHLVPFGGDCTLILGWQGLVELARRAGLVGSLATRVVYTEDGFSLTYRPEPDLRHMPYLDGDAGPATHYYAFARLPDGSLDLEVMTRAQVEKIRLGSKGKDAGPWRSHYDEMARKTVLKRLLKRLPQSQELAAALQHDNEADPQVTTVQPPRQTVNRLDAIADRLGAPPLPAPDAPATEQPADEGEAFYGEPAE